MLVSLAHILVWIRQGLCYSSLMNIIQEFQVYAHVVESLIPSCSGHFIYACIICIHTCMYKAQPLFYSSLMNMNIYLVNSNLLPNSGKCEYISHKFLCPIYGHHEMIHHKYCVNVKFIFMSHLWMP